MKGQLSEFFKKVKNFSFEIICLLFLVTFIIVAVVFYLQEQKEYSEVQKKLEESKDKIEQLEREFQYYQENSSRNFVIEVNSNYEKRNWEKVIEIFEEYSQFIEKYASLDRIELTILIQAAYAYYMVGRDLNDEVSSEEYLRKSLELLDMYIEKQPTSIAYYLKGLNLLSLGSYQSRNSIDDYSKAAEYFTEAKNLSENKSEKDKIIYHIAYSEVSLGLEYKKKKQFDDAIDKLNEAKDLLTPIQYDNKDNLIKRIDGHLKEIDYERRL